MAGRRVKASPVSGKTNQEKKKVNSSTKSNKTGKRVTKKKVSTTATANVKKGKQSVAITLDPIITLTEVTGLREKFLKLLDVGEIQIDASKVEHIDTGGLQLLLAFAKAYKNHGGQITWVGWSAPCLNTAESLGLAKLLDMK